MNQLLDLLSFDATTSTAPDAGSRTGSEARQFAVRPRFVARPRPSGGKRWSGSLCDHDLQCLVSIIEDDLIPQLLSSYSPARHAPDDRFVAP